MSEKPDFQPDESERDAAKVNPYASPLQANDDDVPAMTHGIDPPAPWEPGWLIAAPAAVTCGFAVVLIGFLVQSAWINVLILPCVAMAGLAILVKVLHSQTPVVLPAYILLSFAFAVASYVLFVPVCLVTVLPIGLLASSSGPSSELLPVIIFSIPVAVTLVLFTLLLRLYLRSKHRSFVYRERLKNQYLQAQQHYNAASPYTPDGPPDT